MFSVVLFEVLGTLCRKVLETSNEKKTKTFFGASPRLKIGEEHNPLLSNAAKSDPHNVEQSAPICRTAMELSIVTACQYIVTDTARMTDFAQRTWLYVDIFMLFLTSMLTRLYIHLYSPQQGFIQPFVSGGV